MSVVALIIWGFCIAVTFFFFGCQFCLLYSKRLQVKLSLKKATEPSD